MVKEKSSNSSDSEHLENESLTNIVIGNPSNGRFSEPDSLPTPDVTSRQGSSPRAKIILIILAIVWVILALVGVVLLVIYAQSRNDDNEEPSPTQAPLAPSPTLSPTMRISGSISPTTIFHTDVAEIIAPLYRSTPNPLNDPESPQSKALTWITYNDPLSDDEQINKMQRFYFAVLYFSLQGNSWQNRDNWMSNKTVCFWYGVTCENERDVIILELGSNDVKGTIPREIALLDSIQNISLSQNKITGTIPTTMGLLNRTLKTISYWSNGLTGTLPTQLGSLNHLQILYLDHNLLQGEIPTEFWRLSKLADLTLGDNKLFGTISSELSKLKLLGRLWISNNSFNGTLVAIEEIMPKLEYFYIDGNSFSGEIPISFATFLPNLIDVRMSRNIFTNCIPENIFGLQKLETLYLDHNDFTCQLQPFIYAGPSLRDLQINSNRFYDRIPDVSSNSTLVVFDLSNNRFTSTIPPSFGDLTSIRLLSLSGNEFTGIIPSNIGSSLKRLEHLRLSKNNLRSEIPSNLGNLSNLKELLLDINSLTGTVPPEICILQELNSAVIQADCLGETPKVSCSCCANCPVSDVTS